MMDSCPDVRSATVGGWEGLGSGLSLVREDENLVLLRVTFELSSLVICVFTYVEKTEREQTNPMYNVVKIKKVYARNSIRIRTVLSRAISGCVLCRRIEKETRRRR